MLQGILVKKVLDLVMKQVLKQFKLDKVLDYVEKPNDLDKQVEVLQKTVNKYGTGESWYAKIPNTTVGDLHAISVDSGGSATGDYSVQCVVVAIIDDVA